MKEGPGKRDILSRPASKKAAARPRSAPRNEPKPVPVPLPEGVRHQRVGETTERSTPAHLKKLKQLFEAAPISRYLGMTLSYCENGVARVRLPFRAEFEERHGVIHGGLIGLLADTAGNFAVGSVSPGSTVKTVEFKMSLLAGVQEDLLAIGEVVRKGRTLATCRLEVVGGNDHVVHDAIVKPTALGPVANTDTKLLIYGLFQKGRVLAQDGERGAVAFYLFIRAPRT